MSAAELLWAGLSLPEKVRDAGPCAGFGAKTTRSALR